MSIKLLLKLDNNAATMAIEKGDVIDLHGGPYGRVSGRVTMQINPLIEPGYVFVEVAMDRGTPGLGVDSVQDVRVLARGIMQEPVVSYSILQE